MIQREEIRTLSEAVDLVQRALVPERTQGRKSWHREDWCIARFVYRQLLAGLYNFPVTITRPPQDPPDFYLTVGGSAPISVEVRDIGPETHQAASTALERAPTGTVVMGGHLIRPGEKARGRGWAGETNHLKDWAGYVHEGVADKTAGLPRQAAAARFEVLLYDQTHVPCVDPVAAAALVSVVAPAQMPTGPRSFDRVSVISHADLLLDVYGARLLIERKGSEPQ